MPPYCILPSPGDVYGWIDVGGSVVLGGMELHCEGAPSGMIWSEHIL